MPRVESSVTINAPIEDAFALSMSQLEVRYARDPFVREQRLLHGATKPAKGVRSCVATWRYTFSIRPSFLSPIGDRIGMWLLGRDIDNRLARFAIGCEDAELVARAHEQLGTSPA